MTESVPSTTTAEQDKQTAGVRDAESIQAAGIREAEIRRTAGQRYTSLMWESTQALIALSVVVTTLFIDGKVALMGGTTTEVQSSALMQLNVMAALVTGFYFGRTNHQRVGGVAV